MFEDNNGDKSKDAQYNGQEKTDKTTNDVRQYITHKPKDRKTRNPITNQ